MQAFFEIIDCENFLECLVFKDLGNTNILNYVRFSIVCCIYCRFGIVRNYYNIWLSGLKFIFLLLNIKAAIRQYQFNLGLF